jgi:acyl carrier protein
MGDASVPIAETIRRIISDQLKRPSEDISLESELAALGIESLDLLEIIFEIETKFNIHVPYNANEVDKLPLTTVADVVRAVEAATNGR